MNYRDNAYLNQWCNADYWKYLLHARIEIYVIYWADEYGVVLSWIVWINNPVTGPKIAILWSTYLHGDTFAPFAILGPVTGLFIQTIQLNTTPYSSAQYIT